MAEDLETWLLDVGDEIIVKRGAADAAGSTPLSEAEQAVYCMWVIDYAVRNSGTLDPAEELHPRALFELTTLARTNHLSVLSEWLAGALDEEKFCDDYYDHFDAVCGELQLFYERL